MHRIGSPSLLQQACSMRWLLHTGRLVGLEGYKRLRFWCFDSRSFELAYAPSLATGHEHRRPNEGATMPARTRRKLIYQIRHQALPYLCRGASAEVRVAVSVTGPEPTGVLVSRREMFTRHAAAQPTFSSMTSPVHIIPAWRAKNNKSTLGSICRHIVPYIETPGPLTLGSAGGGKPSAAAGELISTTSSHPE